MARKIIIAMSGFKQSGKDTVCDVVENALTNDFKYGSQIASVNRESFASPIRAVVKEIFGLDYNSIENKEANQKSTKFFFKQPKSYRDLLILIGEGMKSLINKNVWVYSLERHILDIFKEDAQADQVYIVPDVRYHQEFKMLQRMKKRGFEVYHYAVLRKEALPEWVKVGLFPNKEEEFEIIKTDFETDASEYEWCLENPGYADKIENDGTMEDLKAEVSAKVLDKIWK